MSQLIKSLLSGPVPPSVPTSFVGDSGTATPVTNVLKILGNPDIQVTGSGNTLQLTDLVKLTPYVVDPTPGEAPYQTIQSALNAAGASGKTAALIYLRPGVYTENPIIPAMNITISGDRGTNASLVGTITPTPAHNLEVTQMLLQSPTDIVASNASGSGSIEISTSFLLSTSGYVYNLPNWTGLLLMDDCGEASTNDGVVNNSAGCSIKMINVEIGAGTGKTLTIVGNNSTLRIDTCNVNCPVLFSGTGNFIFQNGCVFRNPVTLGGSLSGTIIETCFLTGSSTPLTWNSSGTGTISDGAFISSANPIIAGTGIGTLNLGGISLIGNGIIANTLTISESSVFLIGGTLNLTANGPQILTGSGVPSLSAPQGSLYINTSAATNITRMYINTDGSTGWAFFTSSA